MPVISPERSRVVIWREVKALTKMETKTPGLHYQSKVLEQLLIQGFSLILLSSTLYNSSEDIKTTVVSQIKF
jgi:hypothetical protein